MRFRIIRSHYFMIFLIWLLTFIIKVKYNGLILGFDYGLYHPDGSLYTFRSLTYLGKSELQSGLEVSNWYASHATKGNIFSPESLFFENNGNWAQYSLRIIYPLLSIPFVYLFGIPGMLLIPALSFLLFLIVIIRLANHYMVPGIGLLLAIFFTFSTTLNRWMFANVSDGFLVAVMSLFLYVVITNQSLKLENTATLAAIAFSTFTRFCLVMWLAISIFYILKRRFRKSILIGFFSILFSIPVFMHPFKHAVLPGYESDSSISKFLYFPLSIAKSTFYEFAELLVLDKVLLAILLAGLYFALKMKFRESSQMFLIVLIGLFSQGAINGVIGVNFRYELPILPFLAWVILDYSSFYKNKLTIAPLS